MKEIELGVVQERFADIAVFKEGALPRVRWRLERQV